MPSFIGNCDGATRSGRFQDSIQGAQAVMFQCPSCGAGKSVAKKTAAGSSAAHTTSKSASRIRSARRPRPPEYDDNPRWEMTGSSLDDLTLMPSVNCDVPWKDDAGVEHPSSCKFHGWVKNGDVA
jgi:hypothetical protein